MPLAVTAALGAVGAALHSIEINTALDPVNGLAVRFAPISVCMSAVAILAMVIVFALSFLDKGRDVEPVYHTAFALKTPAALILSVLLGALMIFGAYLCLRDGVGIRNSKQLALILAIFAALAGISYIVTSLMAYLKKSGAETMLCSFIIALFLCLWLIIYYKEKAAEPALISYVYDFLAICAAAIASYYTAGYAFGRSRPRCTLFFSMAAAFFCLTAMPTAMTPAFRIFFGVVAVRQLINVFLLANNPQYRSGEAQESEER